MKPRAPQFSLVTAERIRSLRMCEGHTIKTNTRTGMWEAIECLVILCLGILKQVCGSQLKLMNRGSGYYCVDHHSSHRPIHRQSSWYHIVENKSCSFCCIITRASCPSKQVRRERALHSCLIPGKLTEGTGSNLDVVLATVAEACRALFSLCKHSDEKFLPNHYTAIIIKLHWFLRSIRRRTVHWIPKPFCRFRKTVQSVSVIPFVIILNCVYFP